jgi:hypothetical protein
MNFKDYGVMYPSVPKQPPENKYTSVPFLGFCMRIYVGCCIDFSLYFHLVLPGISGVIFVGLEKCVV